MRGKIFGLLALGLLCGSTAQARFVYEIEATCTERGLYDMRTGDLVEALPSCPGIVIGRVVMPGAYVPGTVASWSSFTGDYRLAPLQFTIFGDEWDRCLPGACVDSGDILLPILEGPGRVHMRADPGHLQVDEAAWRHTYEYNFSPGTYYEADGTAMIFRQISVFEPGTLALLGLGLAGLGLSRRRRTA
jgi:hypothetical protein